VDFAVDANFGQSRVEIERMPGDGEGVIGTVEYGLLVESNSALKALFANVALGFCQFWTWRLSDLPNLPMGRSHQTRF